jgi:uncharacterized membrane protein YqaE (UPF0057 family)
MLYILAFFVLPLAVLFTGKPFQALLNLGLTALLWFRGAIHAILVVKDHKADKRMEKQVKLMKQQ